MDPYDKDDRRKFFAAVKHHRKVMAPFLLTRERLIRDLAGAFFGKNKVTEECRTVINLTLQMAETTMLAVAAHRPRALVTSRTKGRKAFAKHKQLAINNLADEIRLEESLKAAAMNAFVGLSPAKVYLSSAPPVQIEEDVWMDPGQPFCSDISPDDFVFDTMATDFRKVRFSGDRRRVRFEVVRNGPYDLSREHREKIKPISRHDYDTESKLARNIGKSVEFDPGEFEPMVDLIDIYFPHDNLIAVWACRGDMDIIDTDPLTTYEWAGLETGPYHLLNLGPVPEHTMPTSPAQNLKYLSDLINSLYRKLALQAEKQKRVNIVDSTAGDDARRVEAVGDNGYAYVQNKEGLGVFGTGGVDQQTWQFSNGMVDLFDRMGGNLSARMGLGPQSDTASQDKMIMSQVNRHEAYMQQNMLVFAKGIMEHLGFLLFNDMTKTIPGKMPVKNTGIEVKSDWTPEDREGKFSDYDIGLEPYSQPYKSPSERSSVLRQFVMELAPLMPLLQQQGWQLDLTTYLELQAELLDSPRLLEIFKPIIPDPQMQQGQGGSNQATQSPVTHRETVRRSEGSGQQQQQGAGPQQESAPLGMSNGMAGAV